MDIGARFAGWREWRRCAPAAMSIAVNAAIFGWLAGSLDANGRARPAAPLRSIAVVLTPDIPVEPPRLALAPAPRPERRQPKPRPDLAPLTGSPTAPASDEATISADAGGVSLSPPSLVEAVPLGLRGLLKAEDPCANVLDRLKPDCASRWSQMATLGDLLIEPSIEEMQKLYPGFAPPRFGACSKHMGCYSDYEGEWRSLNGTRAVGLKSPMAGGAGSLGGMHDMVGRLAPPNPYHVDPGFGD